jgi:hypothetical protein
VARARIGTDREPLDLAKNAKRRYYYRYFYIRPTLFRGPDQSVIKSHAHDARETSVEALVQVKVENPLQFPFPPSLPLSLRTTLSLLHHRFHFI